MRRYAEEPEQIQPRREPVAEQGRFEVKEPEPEEAAVESAELDAGVDSRHDQRQKRDRLGAPGRFYAVARGIKPGVYQSWFAAANQVLNVPGSMQERFSSRLEALQFITSYLYSTGCNDDIF